MTEKQNTIKIGFWQSKYEPDLPAPVPNAEIWEGQADFVLGLHRLQDSLTPIRYRGSSTCRCCGQLNGSEEYSYGLYRWPSGLMHYVTAHNVRPNNDEFVKWVIQRGRA